MSGFMLIEPLRPKVDGQGGPQFLMGGHAHAFTKDVIAALLDPPQETPVDRRHNLSGNQPAPVLRRKEMARFGEEAASPVRLELHEPNESVLINAREQFIGTHAELIEVRAGEVDAPAARVALDIPQDVDKLQGLAEIHGVVARAEVRITEDLDRNQPNGRGHAIAVNREVIKGLIARPCQIHLEAEDEVLEGL